MMWNEMSINHLKSKIDSGIPIKSIIREMSIECILEDKDTPSFPFFVDKDKVDVNLRSDNITYSCSEEEIKKIIHYRKTPSDLFVSKESKFIGYKNEILKIFRNERFSIFHCSNKVGTTYMLMCCAIDYMINNTGKNILIVSCDCDVSDFLDIYRKVPFYLKIGISKVSKDRILFENGTDLTITSNKYYGFTIDLTIIDDISKFDSLLIKNLIPQFSSISNSQFIGSCSDKIIFDNFELSLIKKYDLTPFCRDDKLTEIFN